jgi:hypothetical protein
MFKALISLCVCTLVWGAELFNIELRKGYSHVMLRMAHLSIISLNFTIIYFVLSLIKPFYPRKIKNLFIDALYLVSFSLNTLSVTAHWYLESIDPELVVQDIIEVNSDSFFCHLFLFGGNLVLLIWYGLNLEHFSRINYKPIVWFMLAFAFWYMGVLFGIKMVVGEYPYYFVGRMKTGEYWQLALVLGTMNILGVVGVEKLIRASINFNKDKHRR